MQTNDSQKERPNDFATAESLADSIDVEPLPTDPTDEWPVEYDGMEFYPIPDSWIAAPRAHDRDPYAEPDQLYAVSAAAADGFIVVRYAHPTLPGVLHKQTNWLSMQDSYVPRALATVGWPRSLPIDREQPQDYREPCERRHLVELWSERSDDVATDEDMKAMLADGGNPLPLFDGGNQ